MSLGRLFSFLLLTIAASVTGFAQDRFTEVDLTVNGLRSGSSYTKVKRLGKPARVRIIGYDECANQHRRVLYFTGLEVGLLGSKDGKRSTVMSLVITSPKWTIAPRIKIGATKASVIQSFGTPTSESDTRINYVTKKNLGLVTFHFRNGKLIRAEMMETLC